ncbi:GNAT family N-acetyltransferase [Terrabacter sp. NPDC080008]|uniref:GNAT family N-acetyltransferase n=1 Tax=Terrabacter sp. NPDC080008 TaxID=3155176 RepID=UPI00344C088E
MNPPVLTTRSSTGLADRREAARIWAQATAHRDGDPDPATVEESLPVIDRALGPVGASLHLAELDGRVVGFVVLEPHGPSLEIVYLGVDPCAWGSGVGAALVAAATEHAAATGATGLELWVYDDNERAVALYRRTGWQPTDEAREHRRSGRLERRYVRSLA